jgi:hypothetical protein
MSRRAELETRRRVLLERCEVQRAELTRQLTALRAADLLGLFPFGAAAARTAGSASRHPLAWVLAIGALLFFGRTREIVKILVWARAALAVASRVTQVVRLVANLRAAARPRAAGAAAAAGAKPPVRRVAAPGTPRSGSATG